jgi:hypothetical protein
MGDQYDNPNALPSSGNQPGSRKRSFLRCGVGLLAALTAAVLLAGFAERVWDAADRAT